MDGLVAELLEPTVHVFTCGAKRQARLREQILLGLGLGLLLPDNCPVGRYDHIIR